MLLRIRSRLADRLRRAAWRIDPDLRNRPTRDGHYRRRKPETIAVEIAPETLREFAKALRRRDDSDVDLATIDRRR